MTKNQLMVTIHSKDVPEILALYKMTKFDFPPHILDRLMHSFPMMYNTMGSKLDGLARRGHFLQKKMPSKWLFRGELNPDSLNSEQR